MSSNLAQRPRSLRDFERFLKRTQKHEGFGALLWQNVKKTRTAGSKSKKFTWTAGRILSWRYAQEEWEARQPGHALRQRILPWTVTKLEVWEDGGFAQQVE
jgi:hypothetical protein